MKKNLILILVAALMAALSLATIQASPVEGKNACTTIQEGVLTYSPGHYLYGTPLVTGYDPYGYNYQAHLFKGDYVNVYLGRDGFPPYDGDEVGYLALHPGVATTWYWPYHGTQLSMKWNDAWISNQDCDGDGLLDRHYGFPTYVDSGAWETNHMWGEYELDGKTCHWDDFVKIVADPAVGTPIWGEFAIVQEVTNDPCDGIHGLQYISPDHPGFGGW